MWNDVILQLIASLISMPDKSPSIGSDFLKYFSYPSVSYIAPPEGSCLLCSIVLVSNLIENNKRFI